MEHQSLREEVARIARSVSVSGLVTGTSGNVSDRPPEGHVLFTPSGRDYALLEPEDVVLVDPGRPGAGGLAGALLQDADACRHLPLEAAGGRYIHTHARFSTTLACLGWEIPPVHYMLVVLSGEGRVPLAPYAP